MQDLYNHFTRKNCNKNISSSNCNILEKVVQQEAYSQYVSLTYCFGRFLIG